jgi:hypothetical protein
MLLRHARIPIPASRLRNLATSSAIQTDKKELSANIGLFSVRIIIQEPTFGTEFSDLLYQSILHGSEQAKEEGETEVLQYSRLIGRNKVRRYPSMPAQARLTHTVFLT